MAPSFIVIRRPAYFLPNYRSLWDNKSSVVNTEADSHQPRLSTVSFRPPGDLKVLEEKYDGERKK
jgi:hypothetical protein